jgi:hypothetical protein
MMNYKELKRKEFLFEILDDVIDGMDVYNYNGSLWLIKTEELKWAVEFTNDKTLWFNYNLFKNLFKAISLDVSENQKYITEWFESRFLNMSPLKVEDCSDFDRDRYVEETIQNGVKNTYEQLGQEQGCVEDTFPFPYRSPQVVEDTIQNGVKETNPTNFAAVDEAIQNGVKETILDKFMWSQLVEDTIQKGVKETKSMLAQNGIRIKETIENGVKETIDLEMDDEKVVEDTIQNGVKETISTLRRTLLGVDDIIQNGVKEIRSNKGLITSYRQNHKAKETIENGVMNTKPMDEWVNSENIIKYTVEYGVKETHEDVYHHRPRICGVIKNGVKEVQPLPAQDGNRDWGNYYLGKQDRTKPFNDYLNDAIKYGKKI